MASYPAAPSATPTSAAPMGTTGPLVVMTLLFFPDHAG